MIVLGLHSVSHDSSAALMVNGQVVAAADEERFTRRKHARGQLPVKAARFCLEQAGLSPQDVDVVAYPWSREVIRERFMRYLWKTLRRRPKKGLRFLTRPYRRQNERERLLERTLTALGLSPDRTSVEFVPHHIAHAASAYHLSGFDHAAVMSIDGTGELQTTIYAEGQGADLRLLGEELKPDSLGLFYTTMTEYLGFEGNDGEYKLMGMAPYGDPTQADVSDFIAVQDGQYVVNQDYVVCERHRAHTRGAPYSRALVERLGSPRTDEGIEAPYTHVAAATQERFEQVAIQMLEHHLGPVLERSGGRLCLAGGCALNVVLNQKLTEHPAVNELYVQPNAGDGGLSVGAAAWVSARRSVPVQPMKRCDLGPSFSTEQCKEVLERFAIPYEEPADIIETTAELLASGNPVAWFQGRMEWGPRALGHRSVLGHPGVKGQTNDINLRVKFREAWRPFCPSILAEYGPQVFDSNHKSPHMTVCFPVKQEWRERIPEVVHVNGTARPQYVSGDENPRFRKLIELFHERTGLPCVINTSLNRRGEPIVCTPEDAVHMFFGSGIEYLALENLLVRKRPRTG